MPISGGKYVAPTWHDNAAPAIDATELQAMSDTLEGNDEAIEALQEAISGSSKIAIGSYVGTGQYGSSNPNVVTCDFSPQLLIVQKSENSFFGGDQDANAFFAIKGVGSVGTLQIGSSGRRYCTLDWGENSVSWYATTTSSASYARRSQLNESGDTYYYMLIG